MPQRNREDYNAYQREYQLRRYHERRASAILKLGGKCIRCGSTSNLEIDHIDWRLKRIKLNKLWSISKARFDEELEKCQLLCDPCHNAKTLDNKENDWRNRV